MRRFLNIIISIGIICSLSGCVTAIGQFSDNSDGDPISGHTIGTGDPKAIVDIGEVRVRISDVFSVRNRPIPTSVVFRFSWTPDAYNTRIASQGLRAPTDEDWNKRLQQTLARAKGDPNEANMIKQAPKIIAYQRRQHERSLFKPHVNSEGRIVRCNDTAGGKFGCTVGLKLDKATQRALAVQALEKTKTDCVLGTIDPEELQANQFPGVKSGPLSIVATIHCS